MAAEEITFREPDFRDDGVSDVSVITSCTPVEETRSTTNRNVEEQDASAIDHAQGTEHTKDESSRNGREKSRDHIEHAKDVPSDKILGVTSRDTKPEKDKFEAEDAVRRPSVHQGEVESKKSRLVRGKGKIVEVLRGIWVMFATFPYWDMAFWSSWAYSIGSVLFIVIACWEWTPIAYPDTKFEGEDAGVGILFFIGALLFQYGATMAYLEAINDGSFAGTGMKRWLEGHDDDKKQLLDAKLQHFFWKIMPTHHHTEVSLGPEREFDRQPSNDLEKGDLKHGKDTVAGSNVLQAVNSSSRREAVDHGQAERDGNHEYLTWQWFATWKSFKTYHVKQPGYVAVTIQLIGATFYGIDGVVALPGVSGGLSDWGLVWASWFPAIAGSVCFLTASTMFTIITQERWYLGRPTRLAWWIGVWAFIGSVGFLLNGIFGLAALYGGEWIAYESPLCSIWGSFAYLLSALLQWYEAVNKGPVLAFPNNRVPALLR